MRTEDELAVLRSKYHDWSSARVADRFAELTPEEIYRLAYEASGGAAVEAGSRAEIRAAAAVEGSSEEPSYSELVRRVTEVLAGSIGLPSFEQWAESYREDPERYEQEMLGFWKSGR